MILYFVGGLLIVVGGLIVVLVTQSRKPQQPRNNHITHYYPQPVEDSERMWLRTLTREPDPLADLVRYVRLVQAGKLDPAKGPDVVGRFLKEFRIRVNQDSGTTQLRIFTREPNLLAELEDYLHQVKLGQLDSRVGPDVVDGFLNKLDTYGGIREVGPFNAVVSFDPSVHRGIRDGKRGESVKVTRPGWQVHGEIIKYPMVKKEI